ncbi:hypothetical protein predicted by Glimmer/Critica [Bacillus amyloliquefaciens DSM 7]|uniref:Uncharacterized protein n=2 Tax=Bacillus subtilis group TaxID=653685 RepID=A0A9P1JFH4_BACAS|nr:hypothetical protein predicted by Glimmer/Critica [Bacillus amyloliquefaciens DSM 7] [Bacillus amyloliquefaciens DSM 7 = ATCC 23350]
MDGGGRFMNRKKERALSYALGISVAFSAGHGANESPWATLPIAAIAVIAFGIMTVADTIEK